MINLKYASSFIQLSRLWGAIAFIAPLLVLDVALGYC
jgi:hypothetical protein